MTARSIKKISTLCLLSASLITGTFVSVNIHEKFFKVAEASVDLDEYYKNVNGFGSNLLSSINKTISSNTVSVGYDGLYTAYQDTDVRDDGKVFDLYSDHTSFNFGKTCGNYSNIGDCYNREHTIPQSWWGGGTGQQGCDVFIVYPSDGKINGMRSNWPYGETSTGTSYKLSGDPEGNRVGNSTNTSYVTGTVFEPFDDRKGDLARVYFYAMARYLLSGAKNGAATKWTSSNGNKVFTASGNNGFVQGYLDMLLKWHKQDPVSDREIARNSAGQTHQGNRNPFIDHPSWVDLIWGGTYGSNQKNGENTSAGKVVNGKLSTDPAMSIDKTSATIGIDKTIKLTASLYNTSGTITWNTSNSSIASISTTTGESVFVTGVTEGKANITASCGTLSKTCEITVSLNPELISVSSISIEETSIELNINEVETLHASVYPENATNQNIIWSTSDANVLSVSNGTITALKEGTAIVTATSEDGGFEDTCDVLVVDSSSSSEVVGYQKITNIANLTNGKYLIVYETGKKALDGGLTTIDAISNTIDVDISSSNITYTNAIDNATFFIDKDNANYTIKSSSGLFIGANSNSNTLNTSEEKLINTISFDGSGNVNIIGSGGAYLRFNSASDQNRFRYYKTSSYSSQKAIQLYKFIDSRAALAEAYAKSFNDANVCGNNDNTPAITSIWAEQKEAFLLLNSYVKAYLTKVDIFETDKYSEEIIECIERYDMVVSKRGYENFMNRDTSYDSKRINSMQNNNSNIKVLIISITSLTTLSLLCLYVFKRRRHEKDN